jgi:hypothetical protein
LGPAIIERDTYIKRALNDHLLDSTAYQFLSPSQATRYFNDLSKKISDWLHKHKKILTPQEKKFIRHHCFKQDTTFPVFYLLAKVHKTPWSTRPIISCSGSLLYAIGVWVDRQLQQIAIRQPSYIKNSKALKDLLLPLELPPTARLFTADAVSMYTNIDTNHALRSIGQYLHTHERHFNNLHIPSLMEALELVMKNNVFTFGNTHWLQLTGTAMGTPPAPCYATIVYAIHENILLSRYNQNLLFYKRYT